MRFNTIQELQHHREDTLSAEDYDLLQHLEPDVAEFVLGEVNYYITTLAKSTYREGHKTKVEYDKRLIASLETSIKELEFRGMDDDAQVIQNILTTLLFDDLNSKYKGLPLDKPTAKQDEMQLRKEYAIVFEKEFGLSKTKSLSLATALTTLLQ